jgi:hypothetical protein
MERSIQIWDLWDFLFSMFCDFPSSTMRAMGFCVGVDMVVSHAFALSKVLVVTAATSGAMIS